MAAVSGVTIDYPNNMIRVQTVGDVRVVFGFGDRYYPVQPPTKNIDSNIDPDMCRIVGEGNVRLFDQFVHPIGEDKHIADLPILEIPLDVLSRSDCTGLYLWTDGFEGMSSMLPIGSRDAERNGKLISTVGFTDPARSLSPLHFTRSGYNPSQRVQSDDIGVDNLSLQDHLSLKESLEKQLETRGVYARDNFSFVRISLKST